MKSPDLEDSGLRDSVAIVTGGSRGIGRAIVQVLAAAGMEVVFTYRDNAAAAREVVEAVGSDTKVTAERVDVRDAAACAALAGKVFDRSGRIDLLVNNAE
jgi:3-oxoacyl-[acyl-carrier protein] reductase